jgi:acetyl esterase/lipase
MKFIKAFLLAVILFPLALQAQDTLKLYTGAIPNSKASALTNTGTRGGVSRVTTPVLEIYLPETGKATGAAVVVCPGGSYVGLTYQGEGVRTAKEFAKNGIAAFVLKYRLPNDAIMVDKTIGPLQDAQQAIKLVRENAAKWQLDANRVGIVGFSAGGHLATTVATHFQKAYIDNANNTNLRPDFCIVVYPVVSMQDGVTHMQSRNNLLGKDASKALIDEYSNELKVTANTPPTYITHTGDDTLVDVDNSIFFYEALRKNKVPAEMHLYPKGGHGFLLGWAADRWMPNMLTWLKSINMLK